MYFIVLNLLLIGRHITAETIIEDKDKTNITSFLPYTLKAMAKRDMNINMASESNINEKETNNDNIHALNLYEKKDDVINKLSDNNNWKRFTTYLPTQATISNQQDLRYAENFDYTCNNKNLYNKNNYPISFISQPVLLFIHLGILLYTLFGIVVLFHRLLYVTPHNLSALNQGYFYKTDF